MRQPTDCDGTYTLYEIEPVVKIPHQTLYRWREAGWLLTAFDELVDADMAFRIFKAKGGQVRGPMPSVLFNVEDCARLRIVGDLGEVGWDRAQLLIALARPFALPNETKGDGHTPVDEMQMPESLVIYKAKKHLWREPFQTRDEADAFARNLAYAVVVNLDFYRDKVRQALADVDLAREAKATARSKARKREQVHA